MTTEAGFTLEKWLRGEGDRFPNFRGSLGKRGFEDLDEEGAEENGVAGGRVEDLEDEDFGEGGETLGNKDFFFLGWEVGADLEGDCGVGAD